MKRLFLLALLFSFAQLYGCSSESVLAEIPSTDSWKPARKSYQQLLKECQDDAVTVILVDGRSMTGTLLRATPDSIVWVGSLNSASWNFPTKEVSRIERRTHTVPGVFGAVLGGGIFASLTYAAAAAQGGGMHEPDPPNAGPIIALGAMGAFFGYYIGQAASFTYIYYLNAPPYLVPASP